MSPRAGARSAGAWSDKNGPVIARSARHRRLIIIVAVFIALGAGIAIGIGLSPGGRTHGPLASPSSSVTSTTTKPIAVPALSVTAILPVAGTTGVSGTAPIAITFSSKIAAGSALPTLDPTTAGSWVIHGKVLTFTPTEAFVPLSAVTVTIPASMTAIDGASLGASDSATFTIASGSVLRLQQLLSLLDYSPLSWTPSGAAPSPSDEVAQRAALFVPPAGSFTWREHGWPSQLVSSWHEGRYTVMTRGLVMSFEADHGLNVNGEPTAGLWNDLLNVLAANDANTGGYNFALANQARPESLTIWHNGAVVLRLPMNSGIAASPTPDGFFPVFARYRNQVMRGTNPDGVKYADPVQYVAYFHGGDAVHYLARASYGIPQSLGCVELSLADAAKAWPWLAYGTPVVVIN
jgi:peptidoglycan hydrolase-like protein with peptidoglycan-binding domain